jgi:thioredoxin 1
MEITTEELKQKIENGEKLIIDFWGVWCGPCKIMKPTFDKLSNQYREENSEIQLYTMDVDKNRDIAVEYGVRAIPTIKVFNKGEVVNSKTGVQQESQLIELVDSLK